jgi:hypothetical protein
VFYFVSWSKPRWDFLRFFSPYGRLGFGLDPEISSSCLSWVYIYKLEIWHWIWFYGKSCSLFEEWHTLQIIIFAGKNIIWKWGSLSDSLDSLAMILQLTKRVKCDQWSNGICMCVGVHNSQDYLLHWVPPLMREIIYRTCIQKRSATENNAQDRPNFSSPGLGFGVLLYCLALAFFFHFAVHWAHSVAAATGIIVPVSVSSSSSWHIQRLSYTLLLSLSNWSYMKCSLVLSLLNPCLCFSLMSFSAIEW